MKRIVLLLLLVGGLAVFLSGCSLFNQGPEVQNWQPNVNPETGKIIFSNKVDGNFELFLMDPDTGEKTQLTNTDYTDWGPDWGPEGKRVVFVSQRDDNTDLYVLNIGSGEEMRLTTNEKQDVNPKWSGDNKIVFNSDRTGAWEIYEVTVDGGSVSQVTFSSKGSEG